MCLKEFSATKPTCKFILEKITYIEQKGSMISRRFNFNTGPLRAGTKNVMLYVPHCNYGIQKAPTKEHKNGTKC